MEQYSKLYLLPQHVVPCKAAIPVLVNTTCLSCRCTFALRTEQLLGKHTAAYQEPSLVPRPSTPPVFDCSCILQVIKNLRCRRPGNEPTKNPCNG